jgi:BNR repeat-like domain
MKKSFFSVKACVITAMLFLISGAVMSTLAIKVDLLNLNRSASAKPIRPMLLGPDRSTESFGETSRRTVAPAAIPNVAPAPTPSVPVYIGFENFEAPGTLVNVTSSSQGPSAHTVEYLAHDAGEPSVGVNWQSTQDSTKGITAFQSDLQTAFIKFDDSCPASGLKASWYMSQAPTSQFIDSDPISFTDHTTGRTFCGQLTLTTPTCKISFTDTDGLDPVGMPDAAGWTASLSTLGSGIDHETIGGGPYHSPIPTLPTPYNHAVYFASQDLVSAFTLRSDDGGATWGAPVSMYTTQCGGLHGHVKVEESTMATNGTVYVPNNDCGGQGAVIVSADNGLTWAIRPVPNTASGQSDPAVAVDKGGRAYFIISSASGNGSQAIVATSTDQGQTWQNTFDVGAAFGLANVTYPAAIAGDAGRAAVAFYGSTTGGDQSADGATGFAGVWHLYVAETFDGGATWTTTDVTPNAPMQRGCIWTGGGVDICRNLLDFFDMTVDKQGRVQVGYVNGCAGGNCAQAAPSAFGNAYTATGTIARQSSGKRLFVANDPPSSTSVPGMPFVTQRRIGSVIHLSWSEADTGNSTISSYQILRGTVSGGEAPIATVTGTQTGGSYTDLTATDTTQTYYYKVLAMNAVGASCGNNEIAAPYTGNGCTGMIMQRTPPGHPEQSAQGEAPASLAIDYVAVGEPANSPGNFMFQMKVTSLSGTPPPNSRWRIVWNSFKSPGQQFYAGMQTDSNSVVTFGYGTVMTGAIPPVIGLVGVPIETPVAAALPASNFQTDGTITIFVPKSAVGNPQPGDLLGAVNGRTFTGDTSQTVTLERSTLLVDHTFVKAQRDNGSPAATYTVLGNNACEGGIVPTRAVSRKTHGSAGSFDVALPLSGNVGIECRLGGTPTGNHTIVVTFPTPISAVASATCAGNAATTAISGNQVTVNCTGVPNAQTVAINLNGVNDGINVGNVSIPMGVLLGDVNASGVVTSGDTNLCKAQALQPVTSSNFRNDINASGAITTGDVNIIKQNALSHL